MVIPHPEDAPNYRMAGESMRLYRELTIRQRGRFRVTMQSPGLWLDAKRQRMIRPLNDTDPDGRPLFSYKWNDIWVIFSRADDDTPIVHNLYPDPDSPFSD